MNFEQLTSRRHCGIEGVDKLLWITEDVGAFGDENDGPLGDWIKGKDSFMKYCKKKDVVISAGGNCGMYVRFYQNYFNEVYTYEPDDLNYYCLDKNCRGEGVHKFHGALGNSTEKFSLLKNHVSNCGMHKIDKKPGDVQMYRIDDLNLEQCDLIHLDVEGFEADALMGGIETIKKFWPVVILEAAHGKEVVEALGYKMVERLSMDCIFVKQ